MTIAQIETIERAAIWHRGRVYSVERPGRHHDVIRKMAASGFGPECMRHQGFATSAGRFVDRKEALEIAKKAGQLGSAPWQTTQLFSEDLW